MEKFSLIVQNQITFIVLFAGGRITGQPAGREFKPFLHHSLCEQLAFVSIYRIGFHTDKFNSFRGDTEHIIGHSQIHASRHTFQQRIKFYLGGIDIRGCRAEAEIRKLHFARSDGNTIDAVREPLIRHKLAHVEERENTVRLLLRIYIAGLVASYYAFTIFIAHGEEVTEDTTVHGERNFRWLCRKERITPGQLPDNEQCNGDV